MTKDYTEGQALENIMRSKGVTDTGGYIEVVRGALGIKRLGMLDFLEKKCKRRVVIVDRASKKGKK